MYIYLKGRVQRGGSSLCCPIGHSSCTRPEPGCWGLSSAAFPDTQEGAGLKVEQLRLKLVVHLGCQCCRGQLKLTVPQPR